MPPHAIPPPVLGNLNAAGLAVTAASKTAKTPNIESSFIVVSTGNWLRNILKL